MAPRTLEQELNLSRRACCWQSSVLHPADMARASDDSDNNNNSNNSYNDSLNGERVNRDPHKPGCRLGGGGGKRAESRWRKVRASVSGSNNISKSNGYINSDSNKICASDQWAPINGHRLSLSSVINGKRCCGQSVNLILLVLLGVLLCLPLTVLARPNHAGAIPSEVSSTTTMLTL